VAKEGTTLIVRLNRAEIHVVPTTRTGRDINARILPGRSALGLRYVRYAVRIR
jgi:hypothetical protein